VAVFPHTQGVGEYIAKRLDEKLEAYLRLHANGEPALNLSNVRWEPLPAGNVHSRAA
jgi:hypothetical protein